MYACIIPVYQTGNPTAYPHTPAYWYGYKFGKEQGLGGIFDISHSCDGIVTDNGRTINLTADHNYERCDGMLSGIQHVI